MSEFLFCFQKKKKIQNHIYGIPLLLPDACYLKPDNIKHDHDDEPSLLKMEPGVNLSGIQKKYVFLAQTNYHLNLSIEAN